MVTHEIPLIFTIGENRFLYFYLQNSTSGFSFFGKQVMKGESTTTTYVTDLLTVGRTGILHCRVPTYVYTITTTFPTTLFRL